MSYPIENSSAQQTHASNSNISYFTNRSGFRLTCNISIKKPDDKKIWIITQMWPPEVFIICEFLHENLTANTFKFNFTGEGDSQGEFTFAGYIRAANDLDDAVHFLVERGFDVEGIIGISMCANSPIIYSALYGQVKNIVTLSARYRMTVLPDFLQEVYEVVRQNREIVHNAFGKQLRLTWEMIEETINVDMKYYCERVQGDIYIIHGDNDEICPYADSLEYVNALKGKCRGHFTLGCDHVYFGVFDEVAEIIEQIMSK
ncbi:unnamed protein product [Blepharisma stoltei]|uniref:Uncharacterized protein n=1 Tax=Blepharisma stoltei TaxID=1481888 RepID=A0AAU9JDC6_9CILI|nr:unnamed protein product [Blepharisma stoltei]